MKRWLALLAAGLMVAARPGSVDAREPPAKQIVTVKGRSKTRARVVLQPGDRVAILSIRYPPRNILSVLESQTGPALIGIERLGLVDDTLRVALYLASEAFTVRVRMLRRHRGTFSILLTAREYEPGLPAHQLIGRIPDSPPRRPLPVVLPSRPRRHPCRRYPTVIRVLKMLDDHSPPEISNIKSLTSKVPDGRCSDYLFARVAARRLVRNEPLGPIQKWAYRFSEQDRWASHQYAYSYTALVAAAVLTRTGFTPEAGVLLATDRIQNSPRLTPYRGLLMSDLLIARNEQGTARGLLRALLDRTKSPLIRDASQIRMLAFGPATEPDLPLAVSRPSSGAEDSRSSLFGELMLRWGELTLASESPERATEFFEYAATSPNFEIRTHAMLRLGDLTVRSKAPGFQKKAERYYDRVDERLDCLASLARLRRILLDSSDREALEQRVTDVINHPICPGQALEARFAMAHLSALRDDFAYADQLLEAAEDLHEDRWLSRSCFDTLRTEIATQAVGRLFRNRDWQGLHKLYQSRLASRRETLAPPTLMMVAEALNEVGLHEQAAQLNRSALQRSSKTQEQERATLALADTYLKSDKLYLAEIVLKHFLEVRSSSKLIWRATMLHAELRVRQQNGVAALSALQSAEKSTPRGDPKTMHSVLQAEALYLLGRADDAALSLLSALRAPWHPALETRGVGVNVLSLCVRKCNASNLERLLKALRKTGHQDLLSDRVVYWSTKRGIRIDAQLRDDDSVWKRLDAIGRQDSVGAEPRSNGDE